MTANSSGLALGLHLQEHRNEIFLFVFLRLFYLKENKVVIKSMLLKS